MNSIKKNIIYNTLYQVFIFITPLITAPYASRVLGAEGIGIYSYTNSIMAYFLLFAALGTQSYGAQVIAQSRDKKSESNRLFWEIEIMSILTSCAALILWVAVILISKDNQIYYLALTPAIFGSMFDISWYFIGCELVRNMVLRNVFSRCLSIVCLFAFVRKPSDLVIYLFIQAAVTVIASLSMWLYVPKNIGKPIWKELSIKRHFSQTLVYFIPTIATSIYTVLDKTLIGVFTDNSYENGYYEQATKIINLIKSLVFSSVNLVMGARIAYLFKNGSTAEIKNKINKSMDFIILVGFGCASGLIGIANQFVPWFFGEGYEPVVQLIRVMAPIVIIIGISNCLGSQYYTPSGRRAFSSKIIILGALSNLILNIILIPKMGAIGATMASLIAESLITILYVHFCNGYVTWKKIFSISYKRIISGAIIAILTFYIGSTIKSNYLITIVLQVISGVVVYFIVLMILKDQLTISLISGATSFVRKKVRKNG